MFYFPYNKTVALLITPLFDNLFGNIWKALVNSPLHNTTADGKHNPQHAALGGPNGLGGLLAPRHIPPAPHLAFPEITQAASTAAI